MQWIALSAARGVALWLTHPGGSTEQAALILTRLAERGMRAGGVSIGGDVAVALAGIDARIDRVAVLAATPDLDPTRDADPGGGPSCSTKASPTATHSGSSTR